MSHRTCHAAPASWLLAFLVLAAGWAPLRAAPRPQDQGDGERNAVQEQRSLLRRAERLKALMEQLVREYREAHVYGPDGGFKPRK